MVVGELAQDGEDVLPAVAEVRAIERRPAASLPVQAAAVAATGFVAGATAYAVVRRARRVAPARRRKRGRKSVDFPEVVASRSFLVDVHLLNRD
jgi:hypothetical protein